MAAALAKICSCRATITVTPILIQAVSSALVQRSFWEGRFPEQHTTHSCIGRGTLFAKSSRLI